MTSDTKLVLFDLDGVLLDSRANMEKSWAAVQASCHTSMPFNEYFQRIGRPFADIMAALDLQSIAREAETAYKKASLEHLHLLRWFDGVPEMLAELVQRGVKAGIVTSKDAARTNAFVGLLPAQFVTIQTPSPRYRGKPAPDHLLVACAEANIDPGQAIYIGDMDVDRQAASRAGLRFAHAAWGYGSSPTEPCLVINNAESIPLAVLGVP